jgi:CheY-like chemotaxis protein
MRILIVDDQPEQYADFERAIREELQGDLEILHAQSAKVALRTFVTSAEDLLILDEMMGGTGKDGTDYLEALSRKPAAELPTIIFVTQYLDKLNVARMVHAHVPIAFFLEKDAEFPRMLLVGARLVLRRMHGALRYDLRTLFGESFLEMILAEAHRIMEMEQPAGYMDLGQQQRIAALIRSYITCLQTRKDWEAEDVLQLSIFFAESMCHMFDLGDALIGVLRRFLSIEEALYSVPKYRDHFFHQIKVFLLGFCIVNALNRGGHLKGTALGMSYGMKLWFMTAAFHDIGYPFEKMGRWLDTFIAGTLQSSEDDQEGSVIPVQFGWGALLGRRYHAYHLRRTCDTICDQYLPPIAGHEAETDIEANGDEKQQKKIRSRFMADLNRAVVSAPDHGLYSSLIVQNLLRGQVEDWEIDQVSAAIALHNDEVAKAARNSLGLLTFERNPLSFLLSFCDLAQDWGRVKPGGMKPTDPGRFGFPAFASAEILVPEGKGTLVRLVLCYGREFGIDEGPKWRQEIYQRFIRPTADNWRVSVEGNTKLRFQIEYRDQAPQNPVLEVLSF